MEINYAIVAICHEASEIVHFCGYEQPISENDFEVLEKELKTDPEFGLVGRTDYELREATPLLIDYWLKNFGKPGDFYEETE